MDGMNHVTLVGNVASDPQTRTSKSGNAYAVFRVKTLRQYESKEGKLETRTDFHRVLAFGDLADGPVRGLQKGAPITIEGHLSTYSWEDGSQRRYLTSVTAEDIRCG